MWTQTAMAHGGGATASRQPGFKVADLAASAATQTPTEPFGVSVSVLPRAWSDFIVCMYVHVYKNIIHQLSILCSLCSQSLRLLSTDPTTLAWPLKGRVHELRMRR